MLCSCSRVSPDVTTGAGDGKAKAVKPVIPLKKIASMAAKDLPTIPELKAAIPAHCFKYSVVTSLSLVVRDACVIGAIGYAGWNYLPFDDISALGYVAWNAYWFAMGAALTGWWVIAHECGHRGFSDNT
jgi:omega-6 fatty acid desaturase (delta-12 desaturase)